MMIDGDPRIANIRDVCFRAAHARTRARGQRQREGPMGSTTMFEMIPIDVIRRVRLATCAVHRFDQKFTDIVAGKAVGDPVHRMTSVRATAFLVRDTVLLTNRHVVLEIAREHVQSGNHDHWCVEFLYPQADGKGWHQTFRKITAMFALIDPAGSDTLDVGMLTIDQMKDVAPAELGSLDDVVTGTDVAICGYPLGDELLIKNGLFRFGPVVHAGIISAVAPYDIEKPRSLTAFLTNISTAPGMSGSPVFLADTGRVVGLHYAGVEGVLGCEVPVDEDRVVGWIRTFEEGLVKWKEKGDRDPLLARLRVTGGGDVCA
jgi:S1-C subfamily serine protease